MENSASFDLTQKQNFLSINIMRGIAILMVILVHTSQQVQGERVLTIFAKYGQMGVQMFFIASAFTLCYSMEYRKESSLTNFYLRRFFRIAPGYYFAIALYFFATSLISYGWDSSKNPLDILANVLFVNGLYPSGNNNVVPGGWSIGTEMLFYLIFPFLFMSYNLIQKKCKKAYRILPFLTLVLSIVIQSILHNVIENDSLFGNNSFIYYSLLNQLPVFIIGMSLYSAFKEGDLDKMNKITCLILFVVLSSISGFLLNFGSNFAFSSSIFPFISGLSFVYVFVLLQFFNKNRGKIVAEIGVLSFSGYLIHFMFTFFLVPILSNVLRFIQPDIRLIIIYLITIILTFVSAKIIYNFIELKGTKLGKVVISKISSKEKRVAQHET